MNLPGLHYQEFLGLKFGKDDVQTVIQRILTRNDDGFYYLVTPNVSHVVTADKNPDFKVIMRAALISVCDSQIIRGLSWLAGKESLTLVVGCDLVKMLIESPSAKTKHGVSFGVIGSQASLIDILRDEYDIQIKAHINPPMGFLSIEGEMQKTVRYMRENPVDIWLLAVGVPQQETLAHQALIDSRVNGVALCIGASLDFLTGKEKRAPRWMSAIGLEWLFRLISDPSGKWHRYLVEGPRVMRVFFREIFAKKRY